MLGRARRLLVTPIIGFLHRSGVCSRVLPKPGFERVRWRVGELGAWVQFQHAARHVPAYADFLAHRGVSPSAIPYARTNVPAIDKASYVHAYPMESRCVGGALPNRGLLIDESSGTNGPPTVWVRSAGERAASARALRQAIRRSYGGESLLFLNAYSLGPWCAGINSALTYVAESRVKSVGTSVKAVENAIRQFGAAYHYVLVGYPPFLKQVVDEADIDWSGLRVSIWYGGEGMSESMRRYLQHRGIRWVFGGYGAADLDLGMASETPFTIALRRLLEARGDLAARMLLPGHASGSVPSILQFNPAEFFFETNEQGELLVTPCRPVYAAPKARYNIHDLGHVMRMPEVVRLLRDAGVRVGDLAAGVLDLPLLFLYGRTDWSFAYRGSKLSPADLQEALFREPALAAVVRGFEMRCFEDDDLDQRLVVALEMTPAGSEFTAAEWGPRLFGALKDLKPHFREICRDVPAAKQPVIELHALQTGPFAETTDRIKHRYVRFN